MTFTKLFSTLFTLMFLSMSLNAAAQNSDRSSQLLFSPAVIGHPSNPITGQYYFGFDLGATGTSYIGASNFLWGIGIVDQSITSYLPITNLGTGVGYVFGAKFGLPLASNFDLQAKLRYFSNHTSSPSETHTLTLNPFISQTTSSSNSFSLTTQNLGGALLLDYQFSDALYGIAGLGYSTVLSNSFAYDKTIDASGPSYPNNSTGTPTSIFAITQPGVSLTNYFVTSRADVQLGIGSAAKIGSGSTMVDAELLLSIPLTQWLTDTAKSTLNNFATAYRQPTVTFPTQFYASFTIGIRFPFGSNTEEDAAMNHGASDASIANNTNQITPDVEGKVPLSGRVTNAKTGDPIDATMTVVDLTTNEVVATDKTNSDGYYKVRVRAPGKYSVTADADGYLFGSSYFEVDPDGRILASHADIKLSEASTGRTRLLVFFDFNKSDLKKQSIPELNRAVHLMKAVPSMEVEIAGYTDNVGTPEYNKDLSLHRAKAVKDYLVDHGVPKARISANGYGESSPIADNSTDEGRAENRRVEFIVTSK